MWSQKPDLHAERADAVIEQGRQSLVEILAAAGRNLIKRFKLGYF